VRPDTSRSEEYAGLGSRLSGATESPEVSADAAHQRAVDRTFSFAQEAASRGDFGEAVAWLGVVEAVDGALPKEWARTRESWLRADRTDAVPAGRLSAVGDASAVRYGGFAR
jgi:hypothetical protein